MSEANQSDDVFVITLLCTNRQKHEQVEVATVEVTPGKTTAKASGYILGPDLLAPDGRKGDAPAPAQFSVSMLCPRCRRNPQFRVGAGGKWNQLLEGCRRTGLTVVDISLLEF